MTINPRRRLSARAASTVLVGLATACAYFAFSPVTVAKAESTTATVTPVIETTVTTVSDGLDDTLGLSGNSDVPTPSPTTVPDTTVPTTPPTDESPPSGTTTPTTENPNPDMAPTDEIPLPTSTTLLSPAESVPPPQTVPGPTPTTTGTSLVPVTSLPASAPDVTTTVPADTTTTSTAPAPASVSPTAAAAPPTTGYSASVSGMELAGSRSEAMLSDPVTLRMRLPGQDSEISIEVRPSRLAAAWLLWVTVSLFVVAFWLPAPARRLLGSSVPRGSRS